MHLCTIILLCTGYWVLSCECSRPKGGIIRSVTDRWSDCIGQDRDSCNLDTLHINHLTIHFTHIMKSSDTLLLSDVILHCGMYPAGKFDIFQHLAIRRFPQSDHTVNKPSADTGSLCTEAHGRPPDLKSLSNVSFSFAWITGPATDPSCLNTF